MQHIPEGHCWVVPQLPEVLSQLWLPLSWLKKSRRYSRLRRAQCRKLKLRIKDFFYFQCYNPLGVSRASTVLNTLTNCPQYPLQASLTFPICGSIIFTIWRWTSESKVFGPMPLFFTLLVFLSYKTFTHSYINEHSPRLLSIPSLLNCSVADTSLGCRVGIRIRARLTASQRATN